MVSTRPEVPVFTRHTSGPTCAWQVELMPLFFLLWVEGAYCKQVLGSAHCAQLRAFVVPVSAGRGFQHQVYLDHNPWTDSSILVFVVCESGGRQRSKTFCDLLHNYLIRLES